MDLFDPSVEPSATLREDPLNLHSDDKFVGLFEYNDLVISNDFSYADKEAACLTDTNSNESNCQHSSGSDSAIYSYHQLNGFTTDWLMSENSESHRSNFKCVSSSTDETKTITFADNIYESGRRTYCLGNSNSKNAVAARDNRLKKKKYIASLEDSVRRLRAQNEVLLEQSGKNKHIVCGLRSEVSYLRRVIANQSALSAILNNVIKTPGIKLSTSFSTTVPHSSCSGQKKQKLAPYSLHSRDVSYNLEENHIGSSTAAVQTDSENLLSESNKNSANMSKNNSKQNIRGKKTQQSHEKMRARFNHAKATHSSAVDVENSGDSDSSSVSCSPDDDDVSGGICLHITGQSVSLELCSLCNKNAHLGIISDHSYVKQ